MFEFIHTICFFFFNDTATTEIYTLSLHDALPILGNGRVRSRLRARCAQTLIFALERVLQYRREAANAPVAKPIARRSEEHTSELQSRQYLVCRLLLEKKKIM